MAGATKLLTAGGGGVILTPASSIASDVTINVPSINGAVAVQNASNNLLMNSGYGSDAVAYGCRAWVNFHGDTGSIRASGNVSSVTVNATGDYTVNFVTAMPDANYSVCGTASWDSATLNNNHGMSIAPKNNNSGAMSTTSVNIITYYEGTGAKFSPLFGSVAIFR